MVSDILTPMNHREIEYNASKLSECDIPDSLLCVQSEEQNRHFERRKVLLEWLDKTGKRVFDNDLVMDYGTDCLRLYLLFEKTPKENDAPYYESWQEGALEGIYKFLGKYRRMILTADVWNRWGNYDMESLSMKAIDRINQKRNTAATKIAACIDQGNTTTNRHNIVSTMMELLNVYQKELHIGEIVTSLHTCAVEAAVPHRDKVAEQSAKQKQSDRQNLDVAELCQNFIILMAPYAPDLSKILWNTVHIGTC